MSARDRIRQALVAAGLSDRPDLYDSNIHSWRCEYPDQWGRCTCLDDLVEDLVAAANEPEET